VSFLIAIGVDSALAQLGRDMRLDILEVADLGVEIGPPTFEFLDMKSASAQQLAHLLQAGAIDLIEVEQLLDLGQREAEPLAAQDPAQPRAVADAVKPLRGGAA